MSYVPLERLTIPIVSGSSSEFEIEKVNNYLRSQAEPNYIDEILNFADEKEVGENLTNNNDKDDLYQSALDIIK